MASFSVPCPNASSIASGSLQPALKQQQQQRHCSVSFQSDPKPKATLLAGSSLDHSAFLRFQGPRRNQSDAFKVGSMLNEVAVEKSSNSVAFPLAKSEEPAKESNTQSTLPDASSISAFMTQVADLVKLVDSRDITELQLKQQDCEVLIRKKEALPQQPAVMMQPPHPQAIVPSQVPPAQLTSSASAGSVPSPLVSAPAPPSPAKPKSSHPPLKCPMAGTFYRSPSPGAPLFVKVGDKVQKGQVVCIIEAMKLMNEIEADQSGTIVEILVDDGKSVSLDMPLFVIEP